MKILDKRKSDDGVTFEEVSLGTVFSWYDGIYLKVRVMADDYTYVGAVRLNDSSPTARVWANPAEKVIPLKTELHIIDILGV